MFGATVLLTLATLAGLLLGLAREWLLVADWGVGAKSDALLVAMFLPEALRMMLASGLFSSAALPIWQQLTLEDRKAWLAGQTRVWLGLGVVVLLLIVLLAHYIVVLVGPGLSTAQQAVAASALRCFAFIVPGLFLQALFTVPMQANQHYLLSGLASFFFNFPAVLYLWVAGHDADANNLAYTFVLGSVLMVVVLLPSIWKLGWRPFHQGRVGDFQQMWAKLWPLLTSSIASQGLTLLERLVASLLGEGAITLVNLARKLINIPLIALMSLNQILLSKMSGHQPHKRKDIMLFGLNVCSILTLPSAVAIVCGAPSLVTLFLPKGLAHGPLPSLLAYFSASIVFGSWNALLARYYYASGDTKTPLKYELIGSVFQALLLMLATYVIGINGFAIAVMGGVILTGLLLTYKIGVDVFHMMLKQSFGVIALLVLSAWFIYPLFNQGIWLQIGTMLAISLLLFVAMILYVRRVKLQ